MYEKRSQDQGTYNENYTSKISLHITKTLSPYH